MVGLSLVMLILCDVYRDSKNSMLRISVKNAGKHCDESINLSHYDTSHVVLCSIAESCVAVWKSLWKR